MPKETKIVESVFLTEPEVARHLRVSPQTVKYWRREGTGPPYAVFGRLIRYPRVDFLDWVQGRTNGRN